MLFSDQFIANFLLSVPVKKN